MTSTTCRWVLVGCLLIGGMAYPVEGDDSPATTVPTTSDAAPASQGSDSRPGTLRSLAELIAEKGDPVVLETLPRFAFESKRSTLEDESTVPSRQNRPNPP